MGVMKRRRKDPDDERAFQTHVYLTLDEAQEIKTLADKSCRSITQQIRWMLIEFMKTKRV